MKLTLTEDDGTVLESWTIPDEQAALLPSAAFGGILPWHRVRAVIERELPTLTPVQCMYCGEVFDEGEVVCMPADGPGATRWEYCCTSCYDEHIGPDDDDGPDTSPELERARGL